MHGNILIKPMPQVSTYIQSVEYGSLALSLHEGMATFGNALKCLEYENGFSIGHAHSL